VSNNCELCQTLSYICYRKCHYCLIRGSVRGIKKDREAVKKYLVGIGWEGRKVVDEMKRLKELL